MSSKRFEDTLTRSDCSLVRGERNAGFENGEESIQDSVEACGDTQIAIQKEHSDISSAIHKTDFVDESKLKECGDSRWSTFQISHIGIVYTITSAVILSLSAWHDRGVPLRNTGSEPASIFPDNYTAPLLPTDECPQKGFLFTQPQSVRFTFPSVYPWCNQYSPDIPCILYIIYQIMPVSSSKSIQYSAPVFAGLLGWILLKESCSFLDTLFSFLTLAGVFLIAQPPFLFGNPELAGIAFDARVLGSVLSLLSAFLCATILILMRKLGFYKVPSLVVLIFYSICGLLLSSFLTTVLQQWTLPGCGADRIILLANGVSNFSSQILIYLALKTERAQTVALVHSCDILFSFTLEYLFFGVMPNYITAIGTFVIITSFVGITLKKLWESRKLEERQEVNGEDNQSGISNS
ncbi:solute carrier family 35 member G1-like [Lytechinus variegatus]|uniref:solute carrier family 35 member G1-like n=1 Tax=Lytechinus variegatus TaxID=7654 RepID=UPI001BB172CA|nr:solute carrier family 35 member G1-like [Lytechinus variegatus]